MRGSTQLQPTIAAQPSTVAPTHTELMVSGMIVITVPVLLVLGVLGRKRYRQVMLQRRICKLERLWQLSMTEPQK